MVVALHDGEALGLPCVNRAMRPTDAIEPSIETLKVVLDIAIALRDKSERIMYRHFTNLMTTSYCPFIERSAAEEHLYVYHVMFLNMLWVEVVRAGEDKIAGLKLMLFQ